MFKILTTSAAVLVGLTGAVQAATVGFDLTIAGSANAPTFTFQNISDSVQIIGGRIEIGRKSFNFDCVTSPAAPSGGALTFSTPELGSCYPGGGMRPDEIVFQVTDFDPGEMLSFTADIDPDFSDSSVYDFGVLMDGGRAEVTFAGSILDVPLAVDFVGGTMSYSVSATITPDGEVPLPAGGALIVTALGVLGVAARRKERRTG